MKYRFDCLAYLKIRSAIVPFMKKDIYTQQAGGKGYLVRSLYFDTHEYEAYHEKMSGNNERIKFRIRTYQENPNTDVKIRVELKCRKTNLVIKKSSFITLQQYMHFMRHKHWPETDDPVLLEFETYLHHKCLKPKIITEYQREGYVSRSHSDLRITFDHNVKSIHSECLYPSKPYHKKHHDNCVIMEIKFREEPEAWVKKLIKTYGLKLIANSKFTQGIQVSRHDLHHPDGVIIVR